MQTTFSPNEAQLAKAVYDRLKRRAVTQAFIREGYTKATDGDEQARDYEALRVACLPDVGGAVVGDKKERTRDGLKLLHLVTLVFPGVTQPSIYEELEDLDERAEAQMQWMGVVEQVRKEVKSDRMSELVAQTYGLTLCHAWLHPAPDNVKTEYVYVTEDWGCLAQDKLNSLDADVQAKVEASAAEYARLIQRHQQFDKKLASRFGRANQRVLDAGKQGVQLALSMNNGDGPDGTSANNDEAETDE